MIYLLKQILVVPLSCMLLLCTDSWSVHPPQFISVSLLVWHAVYVAIFPRANITESTLATVAVDFSREVYVENSYTGRCIMSLHIKDQYGSTHYTTHSLIRIIKYVYNLKTKMMLSNLQIHLCLSLKFEPQKVRIKSWGKYRSNNIKRLWNSTI